MSNILDQTRAFLDSHSELVVFTFGHWCGTGSDDVVFIAMVEEKLGDRLYKDDGSSSLDFIDQPLSNIVDIYSGKGKLIILYEGAANEAMLRAKGIFANSYIPTTGQYSNSYDFDYMSADQIQKFNDYNPSSSTIFEMSWTMTLDVNASVNCFVNPEGESIAYYASQANTQLSNSIDELINNGTITKGKIPNIISVDFSDTFVTDACLKINAFNLN